MCPQSCVLLFCLFFVYVCGDNIYVDSNSLNSTSNCGATEATACSSLSLGISAACASRNHALGGIPTVKVLPGYYVIIEKIETNCSLNLESTEGMNNTYITSNNTSIFSITSVILGSFNINGFSIFYTHKSAEIILEFIGIHSLVIQNLQFQNVSATSAIGATGFEHLTLENIFIDECSFRTGIAMRIGGTVNITNVNIRNSSITAPLSVLDFDSLSLQNTHISNIKSTRQLITIYDDHDRKTLESIRNSSISIYDLSIDNIPEEKVLANTYIQLIADTITIEGLKGENIQILTNFLELHGNTISLISTIISDFYGSNFIRVIMDDTLEMQGEALVTLIVRDCILRNSAVHQAFFGLPIKTNLQLSQVIVEGATANSLISPVSIASEQQIQISHMNVNDCIFNYIIRADEIYDGHIEVENSNFTSVQVPGHHFGHTPSLFTVSFFSASKNPITITKCNFIGITGLSVLQATSANVVLSGCIFDGCTSSFDLVGIDEGNLEMEGITMQKNSVLGLLKLSAVSLLPVNISIINCSFFDNEGMEHGITLIKALGKCEEVVMSGNQLSGSGSLFSINDGDIILNNFTASNNGKSFGGTVSCAESQMSITNSNFLNNIAYYGGCLYTIGTCNLTMSASDIENCTALIDGGGIYLTGDTNGFVKNSVFARNHAGNSGGSIGIYGSGEMIFSKVNISHSFATLGGALDISAFANPLFTDVIMKNCTAYTSGGAISTGGRAKPIFTNCSITQCSALSTGGAFYGGVLSSPKFIDTTITENRTPSQGGGLFITDSCVLEMDNVLISNNRAGSKGGGLLISTTSGANITHTRIVDNFSASSGGGAAILDYSRPVFHSSIISGNVGNNGAAVYCSDTAFITFIDVVISNHTAATTTGGIYTSNNVTLYMNNCSLLNNKGTESGLGGALHLQDFAGATMEYCVFSGNTAAEGGAIYSDSQDNLLNITYSMFIDNYATYTGGAIALAEKSSSVMENSFLSKNSAGNLGGALHLQDQAIASISNSNISFSSAHSGGGIAITDSATLNLTNSLISDNIADSTAGGILVESLACLEIANSQIIQNNAGNLAGGMFLTGSGIKLYNILFYNNSATEGGGLIVNYEEEILPFVDTCTFRNNRACFGGGIYFSSRGRSNFPPPTSQALISSIDTPDIEYTFRNIVLESNFAWHSGAAIFCEEVYSFAPKFGPTVMIANNSAGRFGGGIAFGISDYKNTIMNNATFYENDANFGGGNVAYLVPRYDLNISSTNNFCENCSYTTNTNNHGYQNTNGYASVPTYVAFVEGCVQSVYVDLAAKPFDVSITLRDQFDTNVTGPLITACGGFDGILNCSYSGVSNCTTNVDMLIIKRDERVNVSLEGITMEANTSTASPIDPATGIATFHDILVTGPIGDSVELLFTVRFGKLTVHGKQCTINIKQCPPGTTLDGNSCKSTNQDNKTFEIIASILVAIVMLLMMILCCIIFITFIVALRKRHKAQKMLYLEIPDFSSHSTLTLFDILSDSSIPRIPWEELDIGDAIGKGANGLVSRGIWHSKSKEREVALKELHAGLQTISQVDLQEFLVEIKYMNALKHRNIVRFYGICVPPGHTTLYLVTELMHYGSVRDLLGKKSENLPVNMRLKLAREAAKGMDYLHEKKLIHRDLKPENLLVNKFWECKVADFGISTVISTITRDMTCIGTPIYMAPEVLSKNNYTEKADVYSFAIVLLELLSGRRPYSEGELAQLNQAQLMYQIIENQLRPSLEGIHPSLQQLIYDCWNLDPKLRPSFSEAAIRLKRLKGILNLDRDTPLVSSSFRYSSKEQETGDFSFSLFDTDADSDTDASTRYSFSYRTHDSINF